MVLHKLCGIEFVSSLSKPSETSASYTGRKTEKIMNMQPNTAFLPQLLLSKQGHTGEARLQECQHS